MDKTYGWAGKILHVDLTRGKSTAIPTSRYEPDRFIGGAGLSTKIFWELGAPRVDAFHPDNPLILSAGPLTGIAGPFNRAEVCGIAPQSYPVETFAYSGIGGKFPSELKYAGYDAIIITGKSDKPVYLSIHDGDVRLEDAQRYWGVDTFETQKALMEKHPKSTVLAIGPAGENLCRFAIILNETASAAGQGGYGAVMGSKNLKAIVVRGSGTVKIARPDVFMRLVQQRMEAREWLTGGAQSWGRFPLCGEPVASEMRKDHLKRFAGCHGCPYQCMGFYDIPGIGRGAQMCVEAWYGFFSGGSSEGYWEGNIESQKLGINNFELLGIMSFVLAAVVSGSIKPKDVGLTAIPMISNAAQPKLGGQKAHHEFLQALLNGIASGKSILAQGAARAADRLGPAAKSTYDGIYPARGYMQHHIRSVGSALHWAMDTRDPYNSCHDYLIAFGPNAEIAGHFGVPGGDMPPAAKTNVYDKTEYQTVWVQNNQSLKNSLLMCEYASMPSTYYHPPDMDIRIFESKVLSAVTGVDYSVERLWEAGDRIYTLRRAVAVYRENRGRQEDDLSPVWFQKKVGGDASLAQPLDRAQWEALKDNFYKLRGWDASNGWPVRSKLEQVGMKAVADKLESAGRLGH